MTQEVQVTKQVRIEGEEDIIVEVLEVEIVVEVLEVEIVVEHPCMVPEVVVR